MASQAYAIILAGGNGERFWPISTPKCPKQFVSLFGGKALIRHAVDRLAGVIPPERTLVITAARLVALTRRTLPMIPAENIIGEPCRRDTAAAVAVACGLVKRLGGASAVGCILTADQLMTPPAKFRAALKDAIKVADSTDAIVTMGIEPNYPATGFGYIELGSESPQKTKTVFHTVNRFVEKPDAKTAADYVASGCYLWNSGMFFWRASTMEAAFQAYAPDIGVLIPAVALARSVPAALKRLYPSVRATSVDYAVMEKTQAILVARSVFKWDDVGSWGALVNHFPSDDAGNTRLGKTAVLETADAIVVSDETHLVATIGLKDVIVVHTPKATLVCAKDKAQDIKKLLKSLPTA